MNEFLKMRLFSLLFEPSQEVVNKEMENAYGDFMNQIRAVSQSEQDYSEIFRTLNITRIELAFLKSLYQYEQGGKCPEICLSPKSISIYQF